MGDSRAAAIRASLDHPVIDGDGHWLEYGPDVLPALRRIGGEAAARGWLTNGERVRDALAMSVAERHRSAIAQEAFWGAPTKNTRDRATAMLPRLLDARLDELGIDFAILYPTSALRLGRVDDDEARRAACRAFNVYTADLFRPHARRMAPAANVPMHTPDEAIAEIEYCVRQLGYKAVMLASMIERPLPGDPTKTWFDMIGLDSAFDYDPVWQACVDLGVAPTFHRGSRGLALRRSASNFVYNHIGHFAAASEAVCKAIFLGGVTKRFPSLNFAFLEGGAAWACILYADLIEHWEKRNAEALDDVRPDNLDVALLADLAAQYGTPEMAAAIARGEGISRATGPSTTGQVADLDDYAACAIDDASDIKARFVDRFYFGCEADDRMNAFAFDDAVNPFGARINAIFGSDIGHFDVRDMTDVLPEAHELLEDGLIDATDFRDFVFANAVRCHGQLNPRFFDGTTVESAARDVLGTGTSR